MSLIHRTTSTIFYWKAIFFANYAYSDQITICLAFILGSLWTLTKAPMG